MKQFLTLDNLSNFDAQVQLAKDIKANPYQFEQVGKRKTLGLLFFNPSLRTRLSTQKAGRLLGMDVMVMNFSNEAWAIEYEDETIMEGLRSEHVKEAAQVVSQYCDVVGIRAFATLTDKEKDESEQVLQSFIKYATVPILNMESATAHPLQALADALTLTELSLPKKPKVVLTWAPHPKALPHAVGNSFARMMGNIDAEFLIANPEGYDLDPRITEGVKVVHNQDESLKDADVVYAKNWSSYDSYGQILRIDNKWMLTPEKMAKTNNAAFMHCLPIRRNVVVSDGVLDSPNSKVIEQANNRTYAAAAVLKTLLS